MMIVVEWFQPPQPELTWFGQTSNTIALIQRGGMSAVASVIGPPGPASTVPGPTGASAYQVALAGGFSGSGADWLASLVGAAGAGDMKASVYDPNAYATDAFHRPNHWGEQDPDSVTGLPAALQKLGGIASGADVSPSLIPYTTSAELTGTTPSADVSARDAYTLTTSGNTTITLTGAPAAPEIGSVTIIVTAGGEHTVSWAGNVKGAGDEIPDGPESGETSVFTAMTLDGGTTWLLFLAGEGYAI